jgi:hypothetical protein
MPGIEQHDAEVLHRPCPEPRQQERRQVARGDEERPFLVDPRQRPAAELHGRHDAGGAGEPEPRHLSQFVEACAREAPWARPCAPARPWRAPGRSGPGARADDEREQLLVAEGVGAEACQFLARPIVRRGPVDAQIPSGVPPVMAVAYTGDRCPAPSVRACSRCSRCSRCSSPGAATRPPASSTRRTAPSKRRVLPAPSAMRRRVRRRGNGAPARAGGRVAARLPPRAQPRARQPRARAERGPRGGGQPRAGPQPGRAHAGRHHRRARRGHAPDRGGRCGQGAAQGDRRAAGSGRVGAAGGARSGLSPGRGRLPARAGGAERPGAGRSQRFGHRWRRDRGGPPAAPRPVRRSR